MDWKNQQVGHAVFGTGAVAALENGVMTVAFGAGIKKFPYPAAFERFLTALDPAAQTAAQADLAAMREEQAAARAEKERLQAEELERRRAEAAALRHTTKKTATRRTVKKQA